jgi:hypothetical protein
LAFVRRLDIFLMTFGCISQVIKYLGERQNPAETWQGMWLEKDANEEGRSAEYQ